jgi:hypothetical protein
VTDRELLTRVSELSHACNRGEITRDDWTREVGLLLAARERRLAERDGELSE